MDHWMDDVVSMMSGAAGADAPGSDGVLQRVKQEAEACSPSTNMYSPGATVLNQETEFSQSPEDIKYPISPASPDRHFCSSTTQPIGTPQTEGNCKEEESPRRLCLVCGDVASGFHYGVASCEACKAFFKRTIQGNIEYTCPASNDCEINKRRRKACQACRFRKCLRTGMLKEGVRLDRVRGGRQKYRRHNDTANSNSLVVSSMNAQPRQTLEDIKILDILCSFEPDPLVTSPGAGGPLSPHDMLCLLSDVYDRELVGIIGWAKQIPGFSDLQLNDQMRLLQSTWAEMLTLMVAFRSMQSLNQSLTQSPGSSVRLRFAIDLTLDENEAKEAGAHELYFHCVQVISRLERISVLKEEYYLLKALVLANSDIRLDEQSNLKKFKDSIITSLNDCLNILRPYNSSNVLQQLLLILPALRQADHIVRKFWSGINQEGKVPMNKLFVEMLEALLR
ncbi:estrogen-related receptor [Arctopsyche grandis]|uniref:estrogen-related receptor n=1 Tax=Arctopsyche grandis TaxID=121162 RepID=UPI00406D9F85